MSDTNILLSHAICPSLCRNGFSVTLRPGHKAADCTEPKRESTGRNNSTAASAKMVTIDPQLATKEIPDDPMQYHLSDSDSSDEIRQVRVQDMGSQPHCAKVNVQGVPVDGAVDSGADITIIERDLFKRVATVAKLRKKNFKPPDKVPRWPP